MLDLPQIPLHGRRPPGGTAAALGVGMSFKAWMGFGAVAVLCSTLTGCGEITGAVWEAVDGSQDEIEAKTTPAGVDMCHEAVMAFIEKGGRFSECDLALVADCSNIVGLLQDSYVDAIAGCLSGSDSPAACFAEATLALQPTDAHHELISTYCDQCLFGVDGCEEAFYFSEEKQLGLGMVALPFNEDVVRQVEEECTTELTCSVELPGCAYEIVLRRLIPEKTLSCLFNPLD